LLAFGFELMVYLVQGICRWDPIKAEYNLRKHGGSFQEAATVFNDDLSATNYDPGHSTDEDRFMIVGWSHRQNLLMVSYTERENRIRIISSRKLTKNERKSYERRN